MGEPCVMTWNGHCLLVELSGEVDHHQAAGLRTDLDRTIREGKDRFGRVDLIFDFHKVSFMDSSGIGVVMGRYNTISETGGTVCVTGCDPYVERILEMAGIFLITRKKASLEEALKECMRND